MSLLRLHARAAIAVPLDLHSPFVQPAFAMRRVIRTAAQTRFRVAVRFLIERYCQL